MAGQIFKPVNNFYKYELKKHTKMKKLLILFAAIMFAVSTSFAQDPIVNVDWGTPGCYCLPNSALDYYKITISIYDNANSTWVISNLTRETDDTTPENIYIEVSDMLDYCHDSHPNTPSFTVTATVWYMIGAVNPPEECCSGSESETGDCRDFETGDIFFVYVTSMN